MGLFNNILEKLGLRKGEEEKEEGLSQRVGQDWPLALSSDLRYPVTQPGPTLGP